MKFYTKRLIESTVVLALLITFCVVWAQKKSEKSLRDRLPQIVKTLNQAVWDEYGPGSVEAYDKIFWNERLSNSISSWNLPFNSDCGLVAVDRIPDSFREGMDDIQGFADRLHQTLDAGPMISPPDEKDLSWNFYQLDSHLLDSHMSGLKFLAFSEWTHGNQDSAIQHFIDVLRMGHALRARPGYLSRFQRVQVLDSGLNGLNSLIWNDPDGKCSQTLFREMEELNPAAWSIQSHTFNPRWDALERVWREKHFQADEHFAAYLLSIGNRDDSVASALSDIGSLKQIGVLLNKWTTVPALKKRLDRLPNAFFENDPLFSVEQAKSLPRLMYVASKVYTNLSKDTGDLLDQFRVNNRKVNVKKKALAIEGALWARTWRDEHGRWPSPEIFKSECPVGERFSLISTTHPQPLQLGLKQFFLGTDKDYGYDSYNSPKVDFPNKRTITFSILKNIRENSEGQFEYDVSKLNLPDDVRDRIVKKLKEEAQSEERRIYEERMQNEKKIIDFEWALDIFKVASPLIQSATYKITNLPVKYDGYGMMGMGGYGMGMGGNYGMGMGAVYGGEEKNSVLEYTIELNLPRRSYWIAEYEDEILPPDMFLMEAFDENKKRDPNWEKPVVQLAGWQGLVRR